MHALILRFDAPMMSFGGVIIDQHGVIDRFPGTAMLTGLIANALGWHHSHFEPLKMLQSRIQFAARWDVAPQHIIDYHTVDLGQEKMKSNGWTTRGVPEHRDGGEAKFGTHIRLRHYWADGLLTLALTLAGEGFPSLDEVSQALQKPARPLFLGRKTCLPARPLLDPSLPMAEGENLLTILAQVPIWNRDGQTYNDPKPREACWPAQLGVSERGQIRRVFDLRDWANQLPSGSRERAEGLLGGQGNGAVHD